MYNKQLRLSVHQSEPLRQVFRLAKALFALLKVTLMIPWLAVAEQKQVFQEGLTFANPKDQVPPAALHSFMSCTSGLTAAVTFLYLPARAYTW